MDLNLTGKRALITGATKGIGLAIARTLAAEGADLYLAARTESDLVTIALDLRESCGVDVGVFATDLSQTVNVEALAMECGDADIVINNAGDIPFGALEDLTMEQWRDGWNLKVFGTITLSKELYEIMSEEPEEPEDDEEEIAPQGQKVILNISSATSVVPDARYICGSVGNAAIDMFTRTLGGVSLDHNVRVLGLNPGQIETDRVVARLKEQAVDEFGNEDRWRDLTEHLPGGGPGTVEQVADTVAFLVSERASHLSGVTLTLDGGFTARGKSF